MEQTSNLYKQVEQAENHLMRAGELLNQILTTLKQPINTPTPTAQTDTTQITWTKTNGPNGEYEKAEYQNTPEFYELQRKIDDKQGKLNENGFFYWTFQDGSIGRKTSKY